jgi:hypothetical protein
MKRLFLIVFIALVVITLSTYIFIPGTIKVTSSSVMPTSENGTERFITNKTSWNSWWNYSLKDSLTKVSTKNLETYSQNGDSFEITELQYKAAKINIKHNSHTIDSKLVIIPLSIDSTGVQWSYAIKSSLNPYERMMQYLDASKVKNNMDLVLQHLNDYLQRDENIYGIHITRESTKDTTLVLTKVILANRPTTKDIYNTIGQLQQFAKTNNATATGNPIYNISIKENKQFQLMCALPISHPIIPNAQFSNISMVKGSFMVTEVIGGDSTLSDAAKKMQLYFDDYRRVTMAVNFTMLVSDRMYQTDTSKWISRLYYPVF